MTSIAEILEAYQDVVIPRGDNHYVIAQKKLISAAPDLARDLERLVGVCKLMWRGTGTNMETMVDQLAAKWSITPAQPGEKREGK